jgi:hypothetical protein
MRSSKEASTEVLLESGRMRVLRMRDAGVGRSFTLRDAVANDAVLCRA